MSESSDDLRYWAFISYSHRDEELAQSLHQALERYRLPKGLRRVPGATGTVPDRLFPVFRDEADLSATSSLPAALKAALDESRSLIVICSPAARESKWVEKEVHYYIQRHGRGRVFLVIADGDPDPRSGPAYCFPPSVTGGSSQRADSLWSLDEPLAVELRPDLGHLRHAVMRLVAGIVGVDLANLTERALDEERGRRRRSVALIAVMGILLVVAVAGWVSVSNAEREANLATADARRGWAEAAAALEDVQALVAGNPIQIHERRTTYDLRGWQRVSPAQAAAGERVSMSTSYNEFDIQRNTEAIRTFSHTVTSKSRVGIDLIDTIATITERPPSGDERVWQLEWDISDLPVGERRTISWTVVFWNGDQDPSHGWAGFRIQHPTRHARYTVIFPPKKPPDLESLRYEVWDHSGAAPRQHAYTDLDGEPPQLKIGTDLSARLDWHVASPAVNSSYRVLWDWTE